MPDKLYSQLTSETATAPGTRRLVVSQDTSPQTVDECGVYEPPVISSGSCVRGKRVAMVTYSLYPDDPRPRRAVDVLVKEGMTVDLICLRDGKENKREALDGITVSRIPITHRRGGKFLYIFNYLTFLLIAGTILAFRSIKRRYDLVYVHNMPDVLVLSAMVPKALGAKVILDMHDPMPELMTTIFNLKESSLSVRLIQCLERWSMARANAIVTVNIACKRIFASRSCRSEKVSVVMNSPDGEIFPFRAPRSRHAAGDGRQKSLVIMYHGSLVERNGLDLAVKAVANARQTIPGIELKIYGRRTPFLDQVMGEVHNQGLRDCIQYFGPKRLEELVGAIEACDVGIIPNHRNAFTEINTPTRMFEYIALGKPVIAPRTPGIQDYFSAGSIFFFEPGDAQELAKSIEYVFCHPSEAIESTKRGQEVYLAHAWSQEKKVLVTLIDNLLREKKPN